jgi:hypothetical protein
MEDYWSLPEPATSAGLATANLGFSFGKAKPAML